MKTSVVILNTGLIPLPPLGGGTEFHIYYLSHFLALNGQEVSLISNVRNISEISESIHLFPVRKFDFSLNLGFISYLFNHLYSGFTIFLEFFHSYYTNLHFDIIHVHGRFAAFLTCIFFSKRHPIVYTLHDQSPENINYPMLEKFVRRVLYKNIEMRIVKNVDHIIAVSSQIKEEIIRSTKIHENKITVIPNGVNITKFKPNKTKENYVIFVGKLTKRKGILTLIKSWNEVDKKDYKLIMVGDGEEKKQLITYIKENNLNDSCILYSNIPQEKLCSLYSKSKIFVLPSLAEGLSLSLIEAMSSGCAIIASNISGIQDIIIDNENGIILDDSYELTEKLSLLINNNYLCGLLGANARETIVNNYSWNKVVSKVQDIYSLIA